MVYLNAHLSGFKKSLLGVSACVMANVVVSSTLLLSASLAHAEYYGPPQTFSDTTNGAGILDIIFKNPDSYQNMIDLTITLIQPSGTPYHLDGYGYTGGGTPTFNDNRTSLSLTNLSTFAGGSFEFSLVVDVNTYDPNINEIKYDYGNVKYTLTPSFASPFSPVPEPETYGMILMGLGLIGFMLRQRRIE